MPENEKVLLVINSSYRKSGATTKCLNSRAKKIMEIEGITVCKSRAIPDDLVGCRHCGKCLPRCAFAADDGFHLLLGELEKATHVLIGTPVYLDFPSPKLLAFLSRLTCMAESTERKFFAGKKVYLHANGYVSGTKAAIGVLLNACEMLGFDIPGRSTSEYIEKWSDKKVRGGMNQREACFIEEE